LPDPPGGGSGPLPTCPAGYASRRLSTPTPPFRRARGSVRSSGSLQSAAASALSRSDLGKGLHASARSTNLAEGGDHRACDRGPQPLMPIDTGSLTPDSPRCLSERKNSIHHAPDSTAPCMIIDRARRPSRVKWVGAWVVRLAVAAWGVVRPGAHRRPACRCSHGRRPNGSDSEAMDPLAAPQQRHRVAVGAGLTPTRLRHAHQLQRPCSLPRCSG
jgi:hypothetical protein